MFSQTSGWCDHFLSADTLQTRWQTLPGRRGEKETFPHSLSPPPTHAACICLIFHFSWTDFQRPLSHFVINSSKSVHSKTCPASQDFSPSDSYITPICFPMTRALTVEEDIPREASSLPHPVGICSHEEHGTRQYVNVINWVRWEKRNGRGLPPPDDCYEACAEIPLRDKKINSLCEAA